MNIKKLKKAEKEAEKKSAITSSKQLPNKFRDPEVNLNSSLPDIDSFRMKKVSKPIAKHGMNY